MIFLFYDNETEINKYYNGTTKELKTGFTLDEYNNSDILKQYLTINSTNELVYNITDKLITNIDNKNNNNNIFINYSEDYFNEFIDKYKNLDNFKDSLFLYAIHTGLENIFIKLNNTQFEYQNILSYLNKYINEINYCNYCIISVNNGIRLNFTNINNLIYDVIVSTEIIYIFKIENSSVNNLICNFISTGKNLVFVLNLRNSTISQTAEDYFINNNFICSLAINTNLKKINTKINNFGIYKENYNLEYFILDDIEYDVKDPDSINLIMKKAEESLIQKQSIDSKELYLIFYLNNFNVSNLDSKFNKYLCMYQTKEDIFNTEYKQILNYDDILLEIDKTYYIPSYLLNTIYNYTGIIFRYIFVNERINNIVYSEVNIKPENIILESTDKLTKYESSIYKYIMLSLLFYNYTTSSNFITIDFMNNKDLDYNIPFDTFTTLKETLDFYVLGINKNSTYITIPNLYIKNSLNLMKTENSTFIYFTKVINDCLNLYNNIKFNLYFEAEDEVNYFNSFGYNNIKCSTIKPINPTPNLLDEVYYINFNLIK